MTKIKGIDILLKAAKIYENDNTLTLLAGDGELKDELKALSKELDLKNIYFLGNLDQDTLREIYNISDVSVLPSRFEDFGLVAVEALACGTPVIVSDVGGLPSIVNNKVGMITKKDDEKMLANFIIDVLNNKNYDSFYIAKYAYDNYAKDSLINNLIEVYKKAL